MKTGIFILITILGAGFGLGLIPPAQATSSDNRDAVHDLRGQLVRNTFEHCVRTRWTSASDECRQMTQAKPERRIISDEERTVYFEFDRSRLMDSEKRKLDSLVSVLKPIKDISGVSVVGYADRIGTADYNERLSQRRAQVVEEYMRQRGYLHTTVAKTRWLGESVPVTQCASNLDRGALIECLQKDRRVTVEIKYKETARPN